MKLVTIVVIAGIWQVIGASTNLSWLPSFSAVIQRLDQLARSGQLGRPLVDSLLNLALGFAISVVVGTVLGAMMGLSRTVNYAFRYYIDAMLFVPPIVFAPVLVVVLGVTRSTLVAIIVLFALPQIVINCRLAISLLNPELFRMAQLFGASRTQVLYLVRIRDAMPTIMGGYRLGLARGIKGMVVSEIVVSIMGLGSVEERYASLITDSAAVWAIAVLIIAVAVALNFALEIVDRYLNTWATDRGVRR